MNLVTMTRPKPRLLAPSPHRSIKLTMGLFERAISCAVAWVFMIRVTIPVPTRQTNLAAAREHSTLTALLQVSKIIGDLRQARAALADHEARVLSMPAAAYTMTDNGARIVTTPDAHEGKKNEGNKASVRFRHNTLRGIISVMVHEIIVLVFSLHMNNSISNTRF